MLKYRTGISSNAVAAMETDEPGHSALSTVIGCSTVSVVSRASHAVRRERSVLMRTGRTSAAWTGWSLPFVTSSWPRPASVGEVRRRIREACARCLLIVCRRLMRQAKKNARAVPAAPAALITRWRTTHSPVPASSGFPLHPPQPRAMPRPARAAREGRCLSRMSVIVDQLFASASSSARVRSL